VAASHFLLGVGLVVVLAVGSQVLASRVRIPPVALLVPVGFIAGIVTRDVDLSDPLGPEFHPLVSLAAAVLVYYSGLSLNMRFLSGHTRRLVVRLVAVGVPVTIFVGSICAGPLLDMSLGSATELAAILVLSGPAVVKPLLAFVRPAERLARVLSWESTLVLPVGVIITAVLFHAELASTTRGLAGQVREFAASLGVGAAGGLVGTALLWLLLRKMTLAQAVATSGQLAIVIGVAGVCDVLRDGTGLIAAIIMGLALANIGGFDVPVRLPFLETPIQLTIDVLVVAVAATVTQHSLGSLLLPGLVLVAALVFIARPVSALLGTWRSALTRRERLFAGWMAPCGVGAAAVAAAFGPPLAASGIPGAGKILPVTLLMVLVTISWYGLTAPFVAGRLGVLRSPRTRPLLVGGEAWVVDLGRALQTAGLDVLMWAGLEPERERIRQADLPLAPGELLASVTADRVDPAGINTILLLTAEDDFNALAAAVLRGTVGDRVFRIGPPAGGVGVVAPFTRGDVLFSHALNRSTLVSRYADGARIVTLRPADGLPPDHELLFLVRADGALEPATRQRRPFLKKDDTVVALSGPQPQ
jgi:NhaP-type Na+/H+ or K+/H+ antiporter